MNNRRVAILGHSNVPADYEHPTLETRVFRRGGAWIRDFDSYPIFREVFRWRHDLCLLFLGSNDIYAGCGTHRIATYIIQLARRIEQQAGSTVLIVLIEPRNCPEDYQITTEEYSIIANSINRQVRRARPGVRRNIDLWAQVRPHLNHEGWHFTPAGIEIICRRFTEAINLFFGIEQDEGPIDPVPGVLGPAGNAEGE